MTTQRKSPPAALLSRQAFTEQVLARDGAACVICGRAAGDGVLLDAHHIIERRLWEDGGYYLENGATLCDEGENGCHMKAEKTEISVETLRERCGINRTVVPDDLYADTVYDKWGNTVLADGRRTMGPLYNDPSVRKVLAGVASLFTRKVKYPRTWHLPWSPGATDDDRVLKSLEMFKDRQVVVTRKMDGENFTGYPDATAHARSIDGRHHPSRDWAKTFWAQRAHDLPENWRVVAENLYAVHSLRYDDLPGYLMGTSIWDESNNCLSWDETTVWFTLLEMPTAPVLWRGTWNEATVKALHVPARDDAAHEGYVVRLADAFPYGAFARSMAKYVRPNHVTTDRHWMRGRILEANGLASRQHS